MKYESSIMYHSKDMVKVFKVFADKALSCTIQKIWPNSLKFLQTNRRTGQKLYALDFSIRGHKKVE
jgi:hypothetical protein